MPLVYSKQFLSESTNGRPIEVNAVTSPGTSLHTVQATATTSREEVTLYMANVATANADITVEFGTTATADHITYTVPAEDGLHLLIPGLTLMATTSIVRAFATATGFHHAAGWVNRAT